MDILKALCEVVAVAWQGFFSCKKHSTAWDQLSRYWNNKQPQKYWNNFKQAWNYKKLSKSATILQSPLWGCRGCLARARFLSHHTANPWIKPSKKTNNDKHHENEKYAHPQNDRELSNYFLKIWHMRSIYRKVQVHSFQAEKGLLLPTRPPSEPICRPKPVYTKQTSH